MFILLTYCGTLSHELGHWLVAKILGFESILHYNSTTAYCKCPSDCAGLSIHNPRHFTSGILITAGGMVSTVFIGSAAYMRLRFKVPGRWPAHFVLAGLALFWSREIFVCLKIILTRSENFDPYYGDEVKLSSLSGMGPYALPAVLGITGIYICYKTLKSISSLQNQLIFVSAGLAGSVAGYFSWNHLLGPILLP